MTAMKRGSLYTGDCSDRFHCTNRCHPSQMFHDGFDIIMASGLPPPVLFGGEHPMRNIIMLFMTKNSVHRRDGLYLDKEVEMACILTRK